MTTITCAACPTTEPRLTWLEHYGDDLPGADYADEPCVDTPRTGWVTVVGGHLCRTHAHLKAGLHNAHCQNAEAVERHIADYATQYRNGHPGPTIQAWLAGSAP